MRRMRPGSRTPGWRMPRTLLLWRHGQTDLNVEKRIQGCGIDAELNAVGRAQAQHAAQVLAQMPIARIVASPLRRAWETACCVAKVLGLEVTPEPRLRERSFGLWEGLTGAEILDKWPDAFTTWRDFGDPANAGELGVEIRAQVGRRVADCLRDYAAQMPGEDTWLFVSHGSASVQGIITLLGLDPGQWSGLHGMDNCHWARLQESRRAPGWSLRGYNLGAEDTALL